MPPLFEGADQEADVSDDEELLQPVVYSHTCVHEFDDSDAAFDDDIWTTRNDPNPAPDFQGVSGLVTQPPADADVSYFLGLFLHDEFFDLVVTQTNLYAEQFIATTVLTNHALAQAWKPTSRPEMKRFFGLYILMGLTRKNWLREYWAKDPVVYTPIFGAVMSRNRFDLLLQFLHFADNATADRTDKLYKVRPLLDLLGATFKAVYKPEREVSIDEELIKFKGRVAFRQYIPSKRSRFGIKVFALCDKTGYFYDSMVYHGKLAQPLPMTDQLGATGAIVIALMGDSLDQGYLLYLDNFYTSIGLATYLLERQTAMCGTVCSNRVGLPADLKALNVPKGTFAFRRRGKCLLLKYHDKKVVLMLSTMHDASSVPTRKRDRDGRQFHRLAANHSYNQFMGGVDKNDSMVETHTSIRRNAKWYKKLGFHYIEEALQNAFIIAKRHLRINHYAFQKEAARALLVAGDAEACIAVAAAAGGTDRLLGKHFPSSIPPTTKKERPTRVCVVCSKSGLRRESRYQCRHCMDKPALCIEPCFEKYHTKRVY